MMTIMEVSNEGNNVDSDVELNLELCIGRGYKRSKSENVKSRSLCRNEGAGVSEAGGGRMDLYSKREIQALRRREAKKKREEKMKKVTNRGKLEARAREGDTKNSVAGNVIRAEEKASDARRDIFMSDDGTDNASAGCSSSAISDCQTSPAPQQGSVGGGNSSDSARSNSTEAKQKLTTNAPMQYSEHAIASSAPTKSNEPIPRNPKHQSVIEAKNSCKAQTKNRKEILSLPQMPCVSATGNGANGKTINGLLYRYSRTEVIIVCVCHGSSFSPAGFVEHAGGVNIANPLKHITVVPSAFGL